MITIKEVQNLWTKERPNELPLSQPILKTISKQAKNDFVVWMLVCSVQVLNSNKDFVTELGFELLKKEK